MELVIAEKPSVAQSIAAVLGATQRKDGYLEGNDYLVSWCVGHLVELVQPESYEEAWKKWSYDNLPIIPQEWQHEVKSDTKAQYQILKKLMHDDRVDAVVCATDAGREGELIFRLTYNMAGCRKPMKRLWISSMEESAIRDGFHNLRPGSDYDNLYKSALCRQEADWLVGINGTRLFTVLYGGKALKVGRVQTPTLAMLVDRESKIMNFKKEAYYMAHIMENGLDAVSEHISDKTEAERIAGACENGQALVTSVIKEEKWVAPPKLYDLTTLQRDANRLFGFTAKQTLEYTQSLYEKKLVTYPRTDARVLSTAVAKEIYKNISGLKRYTPMAAYADEVLNMGSYKTIAKTKYVNDKQITDHYAIIPTGQGMGALRGLSEIAANVYEIICRRFLSIFYPAAEYQKLSMTLAKQDEFLFANFKYMLKEGYLKVATNRFTRKKDDTKYSPEFIETIGHLKKGDILSLDKFEIKEGETSPPKRYNSGTLILTMENAGQFIEDEELREQIKGAGIGTSATRDGIITKLVNNKYIALNKKTQIVTPTFLGEIIYDVVYYSINGLLRADLTASWEKGLCGVADGSITKEEYTDKMNTFVIKYTNLVKGISNQNQITTVFDRTRVYYKK